MSRYTAVQAIEIMKAYMVAKRKTYTIDPFEDEAGMEAIRKEGRREMQAILAEHQELISRACRNGALVNM